MSTIYDSWDDPQGGGGTCARPTCPVPARPGKDWCEECRDAEIRECLRGSLLWIAVLAVLLLLPW